MHPAEKFREKRTDQETCRRAEKNRDRNIQKAESGNRLALGKAGKGGKEDDDENVVH